MSKKLSALEVGRLKNPGKYPLGESLYLQISNSGTKSWIFRFNLAGKDNWMGLGSASVVSLAEARAKILEHKKDLLGGLNPIQRRESVRLEAAAEEAKRVTFKECCDLYIKAHSQGWKNEKHKAQWESTLETYTSHLIGSLPVQSVDTTLVLRILEPIWYSKAETASRLRGRVERILSWATVRGLRQGDNPARWRGHLDELLPKRSEVQKVQHFKALPYVHMYDFMITLREKEGTSIRALEFLILTTTRTNETLQARWTEFNLDERHWTIPAERMKAKRPHRVPLSDRAIQILEGMKAVSQSEYVFPGFHPGKPLSDMALLQVVRKMNLDITVHGFRSAFQDWAAEKTAFSQEVIDMALAHVVKGKTERAYRRGDLFEKRIHLMNDWAGYCSRAKNNQVIDIQSRVSRNS